MTLTQRMMNSAEEANNDIAAKDFQHTVKPLQQTAAYQQLTQGEQSATASSSLSGVDLRMQLLERAQKRERSNSETLVNGYRESLLGVEQNKQNSLHSNMRREDGGKFETTHEYMQKRREAQERATKGRYGNSSSRQRFNNIKQQNGAIEHTSSGQSGSFFTRDSIRFQEPTPRNFNPYE